MKVFQPSGNALSVSATAALLAGCTVSQLPISVPGRMPQSAIVHRIEPQSSYSVLYRFPGRRHGGRPSAGLIDVNGTLYGTTEYDGPKRHGTVFSLTTTGTEKVLYSFAGGSDAAYPVARLIHVKGKLYGTTLGGGSGCSGSAGCGTVYSITTTGTEQVLYSFAGGSDGANPYAGLTDVNGTLYGTTNYGGSGCSGSGGCGTVFSVTTTGKERVLHSFSGGYSDGAYPNGLVNVKGILYGTTSGDGGANGYGTVFSITTTGTEKVLYSFSGGSDGRYPSAGLISVKGKLYGTTDLGGGGGGCPSQDGCGTFFSVTTSGKEKVLHSFGRRKDGAQPFASLIDAKGTLYGTTAAGGGSKCGGFGCGTLYSVTTTGTESVLYRFGGGSDGEYPYAALIDASGTLYGTTSRGGGSECYRHIGCGTVFAFTP